MKRGVRPIAHARDEAVLERVDITILDVARVVGFVTYQVLPEPALPDAALVTRYANRAESFLLRQRPCEAVLDQSPACREIRIAGRQTPDRMQVIGQHHDCVDGECMTLACRGNGCAQGLDLIDEQGLATVQQVDGEEPASAGNERATVAQHPYLLPPEGGSAGLTIDAAAAASASLVTILIVFGVAAVLILPSIGLLYVLSQRSLLE